MLSETVDVQEAPARFAELLALVRKGTQVILAQNNRPLARLIPIESSSESRTAGLHRGAIWTSDDFDDPFRCD